MSEQIYNVKRVAQIITGSTDSDVVDRTIRKLRHWTNEDVLSPIGDKHTGTGVSRLYEETAVYLAALLLELAKYGITVDMVDTLEIWVREVLVELDDWHRITAGKRELVAQFGWHDDGSGFFRIIRDDKRLSWKSQDEDQPYTSSIVVNLTNVFRKLSW